MQDKPESYELIEAIQDFLMKDVMPKVKEDDLLSYKTLVSWNMLGVVSREIKQGERLINDEIERLAKFLKKDSEIDSRKTYPEKKKQIAEYYKELSKKIRESKLSLEERPLWDLMKKSLEDQLEVANPRFSTDN